jgi:hypothetical protein
MSTHSIGKSEKDSIVCVLVKNAKIIFLPLAAAKYLTGGDL